MSVICFRYSWNFARSRAPEKIFYQIMKINKTKYFVGARGLEFLEKRRENVQILQALR
jgi:hypothetical protein